jgi:hypothetical protein
MTTKRLPRNCFALLVLTYLLFAVALVPGCTDGDRATLTTFGKPGTVTVWSGGTAVRTYKSTGKVHTEEKSDGWYFVDATSGELVRVSGTVTIEY